MVDPRFPVQQNVSNGVPLQSNSSSLSHAIFGTVAAAIIGIAVMAAPGLFRRAMTHSTTELIRSQGDYPRSNLTTTQANTNPAVGNITQPSVQNDQMMIYYYAGVGHAYAESLGDNIPYPRHVLLPAYPQTPEQRQQVILFDLGRADFGR